MQDGISLSPPSRPCARGVVADAPKITTMKRAGAILPMRGRVGKRFVVRAAGFALAGEDGRFFWWALQLGLNLGIC